MVRIIINRPTSTQQYTIVYRVLDVELACGFDADKEIIALHPNATEIKSHRIRNSTYFGVKTKDG